MFISKTTPMNIYYISFNNTQFHAGAEWITSQGKTYYVAGEMPPNSYGRANALTKRAVTSYNRWDADEARMRRLLTKFDCVFLNYHRGVPFKCGNVILQEFDPVTYTFVTYNEDDAYLFKLSI
jgi:hypothetical protein